MAELGIIASVVQLADVGVRLSLRLYTFGETVASADNSIISISKDISLTSSVLKELGQCLEKDQETRICSENAIQTADRIVKECLGVFNAIDKALGRSMTKLGLQGGEKKVKTAAALERLKWPFLQPKMQLLRSNLERLKSTLLLMLNVLIYARQVADRNEPRSIIDNQRALIEDLARSNQEYSSKHQDLMLAIEAGQSREVKRNQNAEGSSAGVSESIHMANFVDGLPDKNMPKSRSLGLEKQQTTRSPNTGDLVEEMLGHYCSLVNNLLEEVDSAEYKIRTDLRSRIRDDVVKTHKRERKHLRTLHGDEKLKQAIMGNALSCVESDIAVLESRATRIASPIPETLFSNQRPSESQDQRYHPKASNGYSTSASRKEYSCILQDAGKSSISSIGSFIKTCFRLPFSYINSSTFKSSRAKGRFAPHLRMKIDAFKKEEAHPVKFDARHPSTPTFDPPSRTGFRKTYPLGSGRSPKRPAPNLLGSGFAEEGTTHLLRPRSYQGDPPTADVAFIQGTSRLEPDKSSHRTKRNVSPLAKYRANHGLDRLRLPEHQSGIASSPPSLDEAAINNQECGISQPRLYLRDAVAESTISELQRIDFPNSDLFDPCVSEVNYSMPPESPKIKPSCDLICFPSGGSDAIRNQTVDPLQKGPDIVDDLLSQWTTLKLDATHNSF